jgi:hypothetical protein
MPLMKGLRVVLSSIHGYGVVAQRSFRKGDILIYGDGVLYREEDDFDDEYALILPGYIKTADGKEGTPLYWDLACQSRWVNHSCTPNSEVDTSWDDELQLPTAWWSAVRDIFPGDEITYDYAFSGHLAIPCHCATSGCRGVIADEEELHIVPDQYQQLVTVAGYDPAQRRQWAKARGLDLDADLAAIREEAAAAASEHAEPSESNTAHKQPAA